MNHEHISSFAAKMKIKADIYNKLHHLLRIFHFSSFVPNFTAVLTQVKNGT